MNEYLLARELGNPLAKSLELYKQTSSMASLRKAPDIIFAEHSHPMGVTALDVEAQESRFLLSGGASGDICIWDLFASSAPEYKPRSTIKNAHRFGISSVSFYPPDAGLFITSSYDKTVKAWDTNEESVATTFQLGLVVYCAVMAPRAHHTLVATSSQSPAVRLLDLNSGSATHSLVGHGGGGTLGLNWCPKNEYILASGGSDGSVRLWDIRRSASCLACLDMNNSGVVIDARNIAHRGPVNGVSWSEDGSILATFGHDDKLRIWDIATGKNTLANFGPVLRNQHHQVLNPVLSQHWLSDPPLVFVPTEADIIGFNILDGSMVMKQKTAIGQKVNALIQRPNRAELYSGSTEGQIAAFLPYRQVYEEVDEAEEAGNQANVLDSIYQSLTQTPIQYA